jgi:uncharacterized SAM-binding protein YcdF (DUF218 family)
MFDSNLCDRSFPEKPFFIDWFTFIWFHKSLFIAFSCLFLFAIYWFTRHIRWKYKFNQKQVGLKLLILSVSLIAGLFILDQMLLLLLPTHSTQVADAIVVLGRGPLFNEHRVERAAELWQAKQAPRIFVSGAGDASVIIERLEKKGIPQAVLDGENCSLTTKENAVFTAAILQPQGIRRIALVTDEPHMWRSVLVFRAYGFKVIAKTSEIPAYLGGIRAKLFLRLREYTALLSYGLRGLYFPKPSPESNSPDLKNLVQEAEQYAQQQLFRK